MDRDGTSDGYDLALTSAVSDAVGVPVIASGGAGELEHLAEALQGGRGRRPVCVDLPLRALQRSPRPRRTSPRPGSRSARADAVVAGRVSERRSATTAAAGAEVLERLRALGPAARSCYRSARSGRTSRSSAAPSATCCSAGLRCELDVVVAGDAGALARELLPATRRLRCARRAVPERDPARALRHGARRVGGRPHRHRSPTRRDLPCARARCRTVRPGTAQEDLARRDFTVNAIAVPLGGPERGRAASSVEHALEDLAAAPAARAPRGQLPRRPHAAAAPRALPRPAGLRRRGPHGRARRRGARRRRAGDASRGARIGAELRLALGEADPLASLDALERARRARGARGGSRARRAARARRASRCCPRTVAPTCCCSPSCCCRWPPTARRDPRAAMFVAARRPRVHRRRS